MIELAAQMRLRWANNISTRLRSRLLEGLGFEERTSNIAGVLVDAAWGLMRWLLRAALHLERAPVAVDLAGPISSNHNTGLCDGVIRYGARPSKTPTAHALPLEKNAATTQTCKPGTGARLRSHCTP